MIKQSKREEIYKRDGNKCVQCGSDKELTLDHIIPKWAGGTNSYENLQTMCGTCNRRKGFLQKIPFLERIQSALSVTNLLAKLKLELRGEIITRLAEKDTKTNPVLGQISQIQATHNQYAVKINGLENTVKYLTERLQKMEEYHKIEYFHEVIDKKGYRKLKKPL
mgnify:CR=1 FL=1